MFKFVFVERWRLTQTIVGETQEIKSNTKLKIAPFKDEYKLSLQIFLKNYDGTVKDPKYYPNIIQFLIAANILNINQMIKLIITDDNKLMFDNMINKESKPIVSKMTIPIKEWLSVKIYQEKVHSSYSLRITLNNNETHVIPIGPKAPIWSEDITVYMSNPWTTAANGFVRYVFLYERNVF